MMKPHWSIRGMMGMATLICLLAVTGCTGTRAGLSGMFPWSRGGDPQEAQIQELMASQQRQARQRKSGQETSLYPPEVVQQETLPKTELDLKNPLQLHLSYAKLQEQLGHLTEARSSYEKVLAKDPKSVDAVIGLGRLDMLAGRDAQAEQRLRQAVEMSHGSADSLHALGQFMVAQQRHTEAVVEMQKAVRAAPRNPQYKHELGLTLARAQQYDEALRVLSETVSEAEANYNIGYIALKEQNNPKLAERYLNRSLQIDPDLKHARYWLANIKSRNDKIKMVSGTSAPAPDGQRSGQSEAAGSAVVNALATHAPGHSETQHLRQADMISGPANSEAGDYGQIPPGGQALPAEQQLTPEQWEQWQNQLQRP